MTSLTLTEALDEEITRVNGLIVKYEAPEYHNMGGLVILMIRDALTSAEKAKRDRGTMAMLNTYYTLRKFS